MDQLFENWRHYLSEDNILKEEQVSQYISESNIEHLWENNNYDTLDEGIKDWITNAGHAVLDVVGVAGDFTGTPIGAAADAINMIWYLKKRCWLYAAFSAIALVPVFGDMLGKGGKFLSYFKKGAKALKWLKTKLQDHEPEIDKVFTTLETSEKTPESAKENTGKMRGAIQVFANNPSEERPSC